MSASVVGRTKWRLGRDAEGHREYRLSLYVETTSALDGPYTVLNASGMPSIGSIWAYGNDVDPWAYLWPTSTVRPIVDKEPNTRWLVDLLYSTKPFSRCQESSVENPLMEPAKISGSFVKFTKEAQKDKDDKLIQSSSHERITGIQRDANRPQVVIEYNVQSLGLETFSQQIDTVNDAPLWGLAARKIKLSNVSWSRNIQGTCTYYYTRRFEFDINFDTFDLDDVADKGFRKLKDGGDKLNPNDFESITDAAGNVTQVPLFLDGNGAINTDPINNPVFIDTVKLYKESNFLTLGIPTSL